MGYIYKYISQKVAISSLWTVVLVKFPNTVECTWEIASWLPEFQEIIEEEEKQTGMIQANTIYIYIYICEVIEF